MAFHRDRLGFELGPVHVRFVVNKVAMCQLFPPSVSVHEQSGTVSAASAVSVSAPMLHTRRQLNITLLGRTNWRATPGSLRPTGQ